MDEAGPPSRWSNVLVGTGIAGCAGLSVGALIGVKRNLPLRGPAIATSLNTSIFAFTFFSLRQFAAEPALAALFGEAPTATQNPDRLHGTSETAASAFITGGILNGISRGKSTILKGALTTTLLFTVGQVVFNEGLRLRYRILSRHDPRVVLPPPSAEAPSPAPQPAPSPPVEETPRPKEQGKKRWWQYLSPVSRIPDPVRRDQLLADLVDVDRRMAEMDEGIRREERKLAEAERRR